MDGDGVHDAKRVLQPGIVVMQRVIDVVVALSTVLTAFLCPGVGLYSSAVAGDSAVVGKLLRPGECGGVDAGLELALHEPRVPDVDHEGDDDERDPHQDAGHDQDLAALVRRDPAREGRSLSRGFGPRIVGLSERVGRLAPSLVRVCGRSRGELARTPARCRNRRGAAGWNVLSATSMRSWAEAPLSSRGAQGRRRPS